MQRSKFLLFALVALFSCKYQSQDHPSTALSSLDQINNVSDLSKSENLQNMNNNVTDPSQIQLIRMNEQVENAFSIDVPKGWVNSVYTHRVYEIVKPVTTSISPDNNVLLFAGDARMPYYLYPTDTWGNTAALPSQNPLFQVGNAQSAVQYFTDYAREKFGNFENFKIISTLSNPEYSNYSSQRAAEFGHNITSDAVKIILSYEKRGEKSVVILNGFVGYMQGKLWIPDVAGIICNNSDATEFESILFQMVKSAKENPEWKRNQQARHESIMAKLRQDHANQLASYSASNEAHSVRMQNMQSAADVRNQNWTNQQLSIDKNHEQFINSIRGEHTVANSSGQTFKVDNSHQKYFVNKNDNTYIGTSYYTGLNDLRSVAGVNPDDYQEVKIIR